MWNTKVGVHNINGIKNNNEKLTDLLEYSSTNKIDILGIVETNISSREGSFMNANIANYKTFWASSEKNKKKGSGVGLIVNKRWEKHLAKVETLEAYLLKASFVFRKTKIVFWITYMPPNDKQMQKKFSKK